MAMRSSNFRFCDFIRLLCSTNAVPVAHRKSKESHLQMSMSYVKPDLCSIIERIEPFDVKKIQKKKKIKNKIS